MTCGCCTENGDDVEEGEEDEEVVGEAAEGAGSTRGLGFFSGGLRAIVGV